MKKKLLSLLLILTVALAIPVMADESGAAVTDEGIAVTEDEFSVTQQKIIIRDLAHTLADNYLYEVTDANLLYNALCSVIENGGVFDLDKAIEAMVYSLGDEYAEYYSPEAYAAQTEYYKDSGFYGVGITMAPQGGGTVIESVFPGSAAEVAGLMAGDVIISVDGIDAAKLPPAQVRELISGEEGTSVEITVRRGEDEVFVARPIRQLIREGHSNMSILDGNIAYIDVDSFTGSLPEEFDAYLGEISEKNIDKVILDLRNNGGGDIYAAMQVAEKLIPAGLMARIKYKNPADEEMIYSENIRPPKFKLLVLVNENTASASEFLAMALKSKGRAELMGTDTYGKGCMQLMFQTPTGGGVKFTIAEFYAPGGERIHHQGLHPDYVVENTVVPVDESAFALIKLDQLNIPSTKLGVEQRLNALRLLSAEDVDGIYDNSTTAAVTVFQQYNQLEPTGQVDFYTALKLSDYTYDMSTVVDVQMQEAIDYFNK